MTTVECCRKIGPYSRHVSEGVFASAPLTGKKSSAGLRTTWYVQLAADQRMNATDATTTKRTHSGAASIVRSARRRLRALGQNLAQNLAMSERRRRLLRFIRVLLLEGCELAISSPIYTNATRE
ncbi:MAG TPA: hypothetical protein VFG95_00390 [Nitrospiria bacterium]|nr:hypothetical protein [Nitrospiria bacterium]